MNRVLHSPYFGLVMTGLIASAALLLETRLPVSQDTHFLLEFLWIGVIGAALMAFALLLPPVNHQHEGEPPASDMFATTPEFYDSDRAWLQSHPDSSPNEQV